MYNGKKVLAIVPARAGSKGLPGKNYRDFHGYPLFQWSMLAGLNSSYVDHTVLSTNCPEVKKAYDHFSRICCASNRNKMGIVERPDAISGDFSTTESALLDAVEQVGMENVQWVVTLQPTSPLRYNGLLDSCFEELDKNCSDSLFTGKKMTPFFMRKTEDGTREVEDSMLFSRPMRQDMVDGDFFYHDCGNIYISHIDVLKNGNRLGTRVAIQETDWCQSCQIDTYQDFFAMDSVWNTIKRDRGHMYM